MTDISRVHGRMSTDEDSSRVPVMEFLAGFSFAYTTSTASAAVTHANVGAYTPEVIVRLCATSDCWLAFGTSPTAVVGTGIFLPAGVVEYWRMNAGEKVAAVQATTGGTLSVALMQ